VNDNQPDNVLAFQPKVVAGAADPEVVALLEGALKDVKSGDVRSVAIAWVDKRGQIGHSYAVGQHDGDLRILPTALAVAHHSHIDDIHQRLEDVPDDPEPASG
jgi:hypothetical protein